jgi:hypothetical protein
MEPLIIVLSTAGFENTFVLRRDRASFAVSDGVLLLVLLLLLLLALLGSDGDKAALCVS